jgi:hypothetical protein
MEIRVKRTDVHHAARLIGILSNDLNDIDAISRFHQMMAKRIEARIIKEEKDEAGLVYYAMDIISQRR